MSHKYTFNHGTRYITRGVSELIPFEIQLFIWGEIDNVVRADQVDYLQVFEFKVMDNHIEIEHRQEEPAYKKIHKIRKTEEYVNLHKVIVYVIDDIDHSTMLLSSEY